MAMKVWKQKCVVLDDFVRIWLVSDSKLTGTMKWPVQNNTHERILSSDGLSQKWNFSFVDFQKINTEKKESEEKHNKTLLLGFYSLQ